jgi:hypothetical protein
MSDQQFAQIMARLDALEARLGLADSYLDVKQAADYLDVVIAPDVIRDNETRPPPPAYGFQERASAA